MSTVTGAAGALSRAADPTGSAPLESASVASVAGKCGAKSKRTGLPCRMVAGTRTGHPGVGNCFLHGGRTPNGRTHAASEAAQQALARMGIPIEKDPAQALLELVWEAAGNVAYLRSQVTALSVGEPGKAGIVREVAVGIQAWQVRHSSGADIPVTEEVRAIVKLYGEWTDRLAKYAKAAIDAGIAERVVRLVERQADVMEAVIEHVLQGLELTPEKYARGRELVVEGLTTVVPNVLASQRN